MRLLLRSGRPPSDGSGDSDGDLLLLRCDLDLGGEWSDSDGELGGVEAPRF